MAATVAAAAAAAANDHLQSQEDVHSRSAIRSAPRFCRGRALLVGCYRTGCSGYVDSRIRGRGGLADSLSARSIRQRVLQARNARAQVRGCGRERGCVLKCLLPQIQTPLRHSCDSASCNRVLRHQAPLLLYLFDCCAVASMVKNMFLLVQCVVRR